MRERDLRRLLRDIRSGEVSVQDGVRRLRSLPFEDLGFAKVDHHRRLRQGFPEVIYGEGKTDEQIVTIAARLHESGAPVLITRTRASCYEAIREGWPSARFHEAARAIVIPESGRRRRKGRPGLMVIGAGTSDIPVAEEAALTAELMGNHVTRVDDVGVAGLHRLLGHIPAIQEANVLVVVAGMEGALPSVVAGLTEAPVIAVPTSVGYGAGMGGLAALAGMLNSCASGLVVVNIDNGFGAGYAAGIINLRSRRARSKAE